MNDRFKWHLVLVFVANTRHSRSMRRVMESYLQSCLHSACLLIDSIYTRIDGFYFFFRVFFLPPVPVRLRFTVFGDRSLAVPLVVGVLPFDTLELATFFTSSFDLLCLWSVLSLPFALKCC